jgi:hypothetical protein
MAARDFRQVAAGSTGQYWLKTCGHVKNLRPLSEVGAGFQPAQAT